METLEMRLEKIEKNFQKQSNLLFQERKNVYIVNAGNMNHGKSSMFNSLLDKEVFKAADIRTTVACNEAVYKKNIIFVDTPGIGANAGDDKTALQAYKKADLILFVHNPSVGELHELEIRQLEQLIKLFPDSKFFWKRFCLVMTYKETDKDMSHEIIKNDIKTRLKEQFQAPDFPIFQISNTRYQKGKRENKQTMVARSGILELRSYIDQRIEDLQKDNVLLRQKRLEKLKTQNYDMVIQLKNEVERQKRQKEGQAKEESQNVLSNIIRYEQQYQNYCKQQTANILKRDELNNKRDELQEKWERERY